MREDAKKKVIREDQKRTNQNVQIIEELIKKWAHKCAQEAGTKLKWIDLENTQNASKKSKNYDENRKMNIEIGKIKYAGDPKSIGNGLRMIERRATFTNETDSTKQRKLTISGRVTLRRAHSYAWGVNLGLSAEATSPFGGIGVNVGTNFSSTTEQSKEQEEAINEELTTDVKGQHQAVCRGEVWVVPQVDIFTLEITLSGDLPIYFKDKVIYDATNHKFQKNQGKKADKLQFVPIEEVFQALQIQKNLPQEVSFKSLGPNKVLCTLSGEYKTDTYETKVVVERETPLSSQQQEIISDKKGEKTDANDEEQPVMKSSTGDKKKRIKIQDQGKMDVKIANVMSELNVDREGFQKMHKESPDLALIIINRVLPSQSNDPQEQRKLGQSLVDYLGVDELVVSETGVIVTKQASHMSSMNLTETPKTSAHVQEGIFGKKKHKDKKDKHRQQKNKNEKPETPEGEDQEKKQEEISKKTPTT